MHVHDREDFCGPGRAADLDPLQVIIDITDLGTSGYRMADWLREHHRINLHLADHRRISAQLTHADDHETAQVLLTALRDVADHAADLRPAPRVDVPSPATLRLQQVMLPRDAFFGRTEQVTWQQAEGRISAEMLTPYPPGIPAVLPGERINADVLKYLRSGVDAGMVVPDAVNSDVQSVRVVADGGSL
jgi:arginine decarboxylase